MGSHHKSTLKTGQDLHTSYDTQAPPGVHSAENIEDADSDNNDADSEDDKIQARGTQTATQTARITCLLLIFGVDLNGAMPIDYSGSPDLATTDTCTRSLRQVRGTNQERMGTSSFRWPTSSKIRSLRTKA